MKNISGKYFHVSPEGVEPMDGWNQNAPIKAKDESNSLLLESFFTHSGVFYNYFTRSMSCAKASIAE